MTSRSARLASVAVLAGSLCAAACRDVNAPAAPVSSLRLSTDSAVVHVDSTLQLAAEVLDSVGHPLTGRRVWWLVFDTTIASVDSAGVLRGIAVGPTSLVAASESVVVQIPVAVVTNLQSVAPGSALSCGLAPDGSPYCWGESFFGTANLVRVPLVPRMRRLAVGWYHACGLTDAGEVYCWGTSTALGGGDSASATFSTAHVSGGGPFTALAAGDRSTCGLSATGEVYCWGYNTRGALGARIYSSTPVSVTPGRTFGTMSGPSLHSCALTAAGEAFCWGYNMYGQLGSHASSADCPNLVNGNPCTPVPTRVDSVPPLASISVGLYHTCGLTGAGEAYCWGDGDFGVLGDTARGVCFATSYLFADYPCSERPVRVAGGLRFASISAGSNLTCALTRDGDAYCWGDNRHGSFGDGTANGSVTPVRAGGGLRFRTLAAGGYYSVCGLALDGVAHCWGYNRVGQLGVGVPMGVDQLVPARVLWQP